ncbi:IclR family transcriptional regulator [Qingshengfaniella alkalisoli]|uniref:IclR family transcriptional regulator n=1 Tax=Qingshengfaniella alkalisoli TaxID=2599296 RepID=A0A5B8IB95_9RHOB|nr:IclR family transcriptional regulator [Qingshengfaniella alkalisoli]QDY70676.1 IclR family transcriptional regulator [Qingshengfaniella alkalisoli]
MAEDTKAKKSLVPAINRSTLVLDLVAGEQGALTVSEISRRMNLARSSVHAICATLTSLDLLVRNSDQTFAIGPHVMRWSRAFSHRSDVAAEFARIWDEGAIELQGATITLSVLDGNEVVYIGARNSDHTPWFSFRVGMRLPMAFTATGHAFMSCMTDSEIRRRFQDGMPPSMTSRSPQTLDDLLRLVQETRRRGYSVDNQAVSDGMICFGCPVLNSANAPVAGVAVSLPVEEVTTEKETKIVTTLKGIASTISQRLGADLNT